VTVETPYYVEIARRGQHPETWRCGYVEPKNGALYMSGKVEQGPAYGGPDVADMVIIPFGEFEMARVFYRGDGADV
jgi:hypothetical protein